MEQSRISTRKTNGFTEMSRRTVNSRIGYFYEQHGSIKRDFEAKLQNGEK